MSRPKRISLQEAVRMTESQTDNDGFSFDSSSDNEDHQQHLLNNSGNNPDIFNMLMMILVWMVIPVGAHQQLKNNKQLAADNNL